MRRCLLTLGLVLTTVAFGLADQWENYFPLKQGNSWEYSDGLKTQITETSGKWRRISHLSGVQSCNAWLLWSEGVLWGSPADVQGNSAELYPFAGCVGESSTLDFSGPLSGATVTVVSKDELVTVPAGTFQNCVRFDFESKPVFSQWFAPGVGLVKEASGGLRVRALVKANINGKTIGGDVPSVLGGKLKNVILFIGDGMGVSQVTLARLATGGAKGGLCLDELPVSGLAKTHSANNLVTDSAAAATALASGHKTNNAAIGIAPDGSVIKTLLEEAREMGLATGLVTTVRITHATPAPFATHVDNRSKESEIAQKLLDADVDLLMGGGLKYFSPELLTAYGNKGYDVVTKREDLKKSDANKRLLALFHQDHLPWVLDRTAEIPSLAEMTLAAIERLSKNSKGFFLMVEGGRIDMACHVFAAWDSVHETIDFDDAVRVARDWAKPSKDTLIVVTADHATGGLAITEKVTERLAAIGNFKASVEAIAKRLLIPQPLEKAVEETTGIKDLTPEEIAAVYSAMKPPHDPAFDVPARIGEALSRRLGVTFMPFEYRQPTTYGHDGAMVSIYAFGPGAMNFAGTLDNTEIPKRVRKLLFQKGGGQAQQN